MSDTAASPESVGISSDRLARIRPAMQRWIDRGTIAGASMMIARRGTIVYAEQVGRMSKETDEALRSDAIFRIYSMTKPIVCTALMTLYEEGRFQLITPLATFIPAFANVKVLQQDKEVAPQRPITIGDLMTHLGGFTYDFLIDSPVGELYRQHELMHNAQRTLQQFVDELARLPLAYHPGTKWHYSVSIDVAAHVIEIIADQPLRHFLRERIFDPLGMVDTDFYVPPEKRHRLAAMYGVGDLGARGMTILQMFFNWQQGILERIDPQESYPVDQPETFARGGHGLFSTVQDYMRFALMLLNGGTLDGTRILGRKTLELMHANHIPPALLPWDIAGIAYPGYGFGLGSRVLMDVGLSGMPGTAGEFGWAGAATTYYWVDPAESFAGVFMTQYQGLDEPQRDFRALAYQAIVD
ncbi:serine hydrolase domain-containing protein [Roseiflexus sp. RS-1]|jgi:CubicO group peptidase (beta-lactamase class C family)|uniref:serine hydrolase domain-containing protein n=1 Tax=Roseiflexus sp. (strain RS-1) TaxID=357808 RepID=UPI0000D7F92A|nr:serine hydrolase domain-containing protein [Roseiflexus sp. RS-1]ABQ90857.1 beta-lactamase [Roseiflexus sp. RS-1]